MTISQFEIDELRAKKQIEMRWVDCHMCDGHGNFGGRAYCPECNGTGKVQIGIVVGAKVPMPMGMSAWQWIGLAILAGCVVGAVISEALKYFKF